MTRRFILSPLTILGMVLFLAAGELVSGTSLPFVAIMAVAMLAIGATYNMLGGLGTFGGVLFAIFALNTLVVSQFAKVFMLEAADLTLRSPVLTIAVYAVYFLSLMVGVFLFGRARLQLPRPLEPTTALHSGVIYTVSLVIGLSATMYMTNLALMHPETAGSAEHGIARAFALLLPLSLVIAVDARLRKTGGAHCFGWAAFWPAFAIEFLGFMAASRTGFLMPPFLVLITCYFRGFRFRSRHYIAGGAIVALLFLVVSPWFLWSRSFRNQTSLWRQIAVMSRLAAAAPAYWPEVKGSVQESMTRAAAKGGEYFRKTGTVTLDRFVLIPDDDAVISACSHWHWGLATVRIDAENSIPHFILPNKPDRDGSWYRASIGGLQSSYQPSGFVTTSIIADAWGGFGWAGVIVVPLLLVPWFFVEYNSMFDMSQPWGTVALVVTALKVAVGSVATLLLGMMLSMPIYILLISWFTGWLTRYVPFVGDSLHRKGVPLFQRQGIRSTAGD